MSIALKLISLFGRGPLVVQYLVRGADGGFGGALDESLGIGGAPGAGGLLQGTAVITAPQAISIGVHGENGDNSNNPGGDGGNTSLGSLATAIGGGGGGSPNTNGRPGGSGGGSGNTDAGPRTGGAGTVGQGNNGGGVNGLSNSGAGGGAGSAASGSTPGAGVSSSISGSPVTYSAGYTPQATEVTDDGLVIIRYLGPQRATGGTITSSGGWTIHTFTSSGTFTPT